MTHGAWRMAHGARAGRMPRARGTPSGHIGISPGCLLVVPVASPPHAPQFPRANLLRGAFWLTPSMFGVPNIDGRRRTADRRQCSWGAKRRGELDVGMSLLRSILHECIAQARRDGGGDRQFPSIKRGRGPRDCRSCRDTFQIGSHDIGDAVHGGVVPERIH